jgi:c-di-AMP phosphodiesterase-like protein
MVRFNLKKLNEVKGKEKYRVEVSKRFAALEDLDVEVEMKTVRETISWLGPYIHDIIQKNHCGFQCNRSTTDQIVRYWRKNENIMRQYISYS